MPTRLIARTAALLAVTSLSLTACDDTDANHLVPADSSDGSSTGPMTPRRPTRPRPTPRS